MNRELLLTMIHDHNLILTESSVNRLTELVDVQVNWDGRDAKAMDDESCQTMLKFLATANEPIPADIGYFFNYEGYLSINWTLNGSIVDVAFEPEATYLYMKGFDDGIALPNKVISSFKYTNPEDCIENYKNRLELVSGLLCKLEKSVAERLVDISSFDYGWGEHGDELEMNINALHSLVHFIDGLEEIPERMIMFLTHEGFIEVVLMSYKPCHEIEFTPEGLMFFTAPEYEITEVTKENFNQYKEINQFLTGEIK